MHTKGKILKIQLAFGKQSKKHKDPLSLNVGKVAEEAGEESRLILES